MKKLSNSLKNTIIELFDFGKSDKEKLEEKSIEHEKKFLFDYSMGDFMLLTKKLPHQKFKQFYLTKSDLVETRIRIINDSVAFATTKIKTSNPAKRIEIESEIDIKNAIELLEQITSTSDKNIVIEKTRYFVPGGKIFIDHFVNIENNRSLVIVEVENPVQDMKLPLYCGTDVTNRFEFKNQNILDSGLRTKYCTGFIEHIDLWVSQHRGRTFKT